MNITQGIECASQQFKNVAIDGTLGLDCINQFCKVTTVNRPIEICLNSVESIDEIKVIDNL